MGRREYVECILEGKLTSFMSKFGNRRIIGANEMYMWIFFSYLLALFVGDFGSFASPECSKSQKLTQTGLLLPEAKTKKSSFYTSDRKAPTASRASAGELFFHSFPSHLLHADQRHTPAPARPISAQPLASPPSAA